MSSSKFSESELAARHALSQLLGMREVAITQFLKNAASSLDGPRDYQELLGMVTKLRDRPSGILMSHDEHILEAFNETQRKEVGAKWRLSSRNLSMIGPDIVAGEAWINNEHLKGIAQDFEQLAGIIDLRKIHTYSRRCWKEIISDRKYAVPSKGRAEVLAAESFANLLGLRSIRFLQEGARAPGVFLRFEFQEPHRVGIIKIQHNGTISGFNEKIQSRRLRTVIETIALAYYRDLVTPDEVYLYQPYRPRRRREASQYRKIARRKQPRQLPRRQVMAIAESKAYPLSEWYFAQERARHTVVGHMRWVRRNFRAKDEKRQQARKSGVTLKLGYTWIIEHDRGSGDASALRLDGFDLTTRTVFAAPRRATNEIQELLLRS